MARIVHLYDDLMMAIPQRRSHRPKIPPSWLSQIFNLNWLLIPRRLIPAERFHS